MTTGQDIVDKAMSQKGKPYRYAYEVDLDDPDPAMFDCSELIQWVCHQCGVQPEFPDGAIYQMRFCRNHNLIINMEKAVKIPGALLFRISASMGNHVVISRGDGTTIEARGKKYGVGVFNINGRTWTHAGLIPGVDYS